MEAMACCPEGGIVKIGCQAGLRSILMVVTALALARCAPGPAYDEQIDKSLSDVQHTVDLEILNLISLNRQVQQLSASAKRLSAAPEAQSKKALVKVEGDLSKAQDAMSYASNVDFYNGVDSDLTSVQMRLDGTPDLSTPKIDGSFAQLKAILVDFPAQGETPTSMQAVHAQQDRLSDGFLKSTRAQANALFGTLERYELTLKNGKSTPK